MSQRRSKITAEQAAAARAVFDAWGTWAEIGTACGLPSSTIRGHAKREDWERPERDAEAEARARAEATAPGRERQLERWAARRAKEADEAGAAAATVRAAGTRAIESKNPQMVRACGIFYGILVDKAQLLSGGATGRVDTATPEQRRARLRQTRDELQERRAARATPDAEAATG